MNNNFNHNPQMMMRQHMIMRQQQQQKGHNSLQENPQQNKLLMDIKNKNLIFVSAQPDNTYFHWQVEVYMYQFSKFGIIDNCHVLFGYTGEGPTEGGLKLKKMYKNIHFYKDERLDKTYIPTIRPHILAKFFKEFPYLGKNVFYHDSDILFVKLSNFSLLLNDNISYLSDTISYIGYNYIMECCKRYKDKYEELAEDDLFLGMCNEANINPNLVKINQQNSGGAQYLLKNINSNYWEECEKTCVSLYKYMCEYEKKYPISHHIQKWTADMWAVLWNYWKIGGITKIHKELDFSWATDTITDYNSKNIFHLAGVSGETSKDRFYKALYTNKDVIDEYLRDNTIFDHIIPTSSTYAYTRVIIECANKRQCTETSNSTTTTTTTKPITELQESKPKESKPKEPKPKESNPRFMDHRLFPFNNFSHRANNKIDTNENDSVQETNVPQDIDISKYNTNNMNYFDRRKLAYALLNNIPIDTVLNPSPHIQTRQSLSNDKKPPTNNDMFKKFIYIKSINKDDSYTESTTKKIQLIDNNKTIKEKEIIKMNIEGSHPYVNTYIMDKEVTCCNKNIWRSIDNKHLIFFNGSIWIITYANCEKDIGPRAGGLATNLSPDLFVNKWTFDCDVKVIKDVL